MHTTEMTPATSGTTGGPVPIGCLAARIMADIAFRRQAHRVHNPGPRVHAEMLAELAARTGCRDLVDDLLVAYGRISPGAVARAGGDRFPPAPLREVAR